ncbi:MAG: flavodoxin domain-containing protein [Ferruginibacter sp.]
MLAGLKLKTFNEFLDSLNKEELVWVNGYLAGLVATGESFAKRKAVANTPLKKITIAYGTETGNSKKLAVDFATKAKKNGVHAKLVSLDQYRLSDFLKEEYFITVISTHGEGEPPVAAQKFYDHIHANGFKVPQLKYAVLALGDTSYPMFCKTGEDVDTQLQKIGANRIAPFQKCDLDYELDANDWFTAVLQSVVTTEPMPSISKPFTIPEKKVFTGKKIYKGTVLSNINLNANGSTKRTYHIEIAAEEVQYIAGDSIGIVPENQPLIVEEIIASAKLDRNKTITWRNETVTIEELLSKKININYLLDKSIKQFATITKKEIAATRVDLVQLIRQYPINAAQFEELLVSLNPIAPRIYNIASSPAMHNGEVHITVLQEKFTIALKKQYGLCTQFLEGKKEGDAINFFIQTNKRFRLPPDDKDIIMIGPGSGIAPFRSFVAERDSTAASGRNWLFFGEENFTTDFLYQTEWQSWFSTDVLTKISLAFTNDANQEYLIHHKLQAEAVELFKWIEGGATVYLCGEKEPMSKEVEAELLAIIEKQGKLNKEEGLKYFEQLKTEGRYIKDVY